MRDSNPRPSRCKRDGTPSQDATRQDVTSTPSAACTAACNGNAKNSNADALEAGHQDQGEGTDAGTLDAHQGDPLAKLAAAIAGLTPADRERLAGMLRQG